MSRRTISLLAVFAAVACLIALPAARAGEVSHARIVRLSYTLGDVQISGNGTTDWRKGVINTPLREGMSLATGDGRAEVEFETGAMAWMASSTVLELPQLTLEDGAKNTQLTVKQGAATFYVKPGKHDSFVVQAGQLTISAPENARFRVDVFEDGAAVSVLGGNVEVASKDSTQKVVGHKTVALRDGNAAGMVVSANPRRDGWDRWVSDRSDSVETARLDATDHLQAPFGYGMADLGYYGGWVSVPGYGVGWQPYGVGAGWSPFYNGYWDGFGAMGPTWISSEPWGWLPYHYGGWLFSPMYGWVWTPAGFGAWSPGSVHWTRTPGGIGWVARAPNETSNGTPVNLKHGVVTNTPTGMLAGSQNMILRGPGAAKLPVIGAEEMGRMAQQARAEVTVRTPATGAGKGMQGSTRMPEGAAPRIAAAGMYGGRVPAYMPPNRLGSTTTSSLSSAPTNHGAATSSAGNSGSHGGAAQSHAASGGASGGGNGGHGKP